MPLIAPVERGGIEEAARDLLDPDTKQPIVRAVYKRDDVYSGEYLGEASDLQVGFEDGYRVSWQTAAGGIPPEVFEDNLNNWSGDHCSVAPAITAGVVFSNRPVTETTPRHIQDVAATVLQRYAVPLPGELDGRPWFATP